VTGKQFFLTLSNTFCGAVRFDPDTGAPVSDKSGHGYGSRSIAAFVKKYGGVLEYKIDKGWFILNLLLGWRSTVFAATGPAIAASSSVERRAVWPSFPGDDGQPHRGFPIVSRFCRHLAAFNDLIL